MKGGVVPTFQKWSSTWDFVLFFGSTMTFFKTGNKQTTYDVEK